MFDKLDERWKEQVGADRWDVFRDVLVELATGWDPVDAAGGESQATSCLDVARRPGQ